MNRPQPILLLLLLLLGLGLLAQVVPLYTDWLWFVAVAARARLGAHARQRDDRPHLGRLRAPAEPRADEPWPAAGGRRPLAPARPRRRGARSQGSRLLARPVRAGLLAPRHRVRRGL